MKCAILEDYDEFILMDSHAYSQPQLRVVSAFRTVSTDATLVIAGMMPLRIFVEVEKRKHLTSRRTGPGRTLSK